jgi:hypothetical protein
VVIPVDCRAEERIFQALRIPAISISRQPFRLGCQHADQLFVVRKRDLFMGIGDVSLHSASLVSAQGRLSFACPAGIHDPELHFRAPIRIIYKTVELRSGYSSILNSSLGMGGRGA